jgi:hypothetical protein
MMWLPLFVAVLCDPNVAPGAEMLWLNRDGAAMHFANAADQRVVWVAG